jgi:neopullulanase
VALYFPDQLHLGEQGHLFPWDVRFDPADAAHLAVTPDGTARFRLITEPGFATATLVRGDGKGVGMELVTGIGRFCVWEARVSADGQFRYTFALTTHEGRPVYRVPAGIANAVERLDRWEFNPEASRRIDVPEWARGAVIYQIFPERFRRSESSSSPEGTVPWGSPPHWLEHQGGDLLGIAERADYLAGLGVDLVYVNPIFTAPSTHKYDAVDYYTVDPAFGGNDALDALVAALHARGIRLIVDASFNHCHPSFFAFADVVKLGADSPYRDWFVMSEYPPRIVVRPHALAAAGWHIDAEEYLEHVRHLAARTGILVAEGEGGGPPISLGYEAWYGVPSLPRINLSNPDARAYFLDVARYWVSEHGIDGWRMDVTRYVDPGFWPEFRRTVKDVRPDAYLIAEVMGDASPWLQGDAFDATMNYTFRALVLDYLATRQTGAAAFADGLERMYAGYAPEIAEACQNLIGSHDTARFLHEADGRPEALALATVLQMTLPGAPGLYYGDEVGMTGGEEPGSRGAFPWHDEASWLADQHRLVGTLTVLRRRHPELRTGRLRVVWHDDEAIAFTRSGETGRLLVVVNRGTDRRCAVPLGASSIELVAGGGVLEQHPGRVVVQIPASSWLVARLDDEDTQGAG